MIKVIIADRKKEALEELKTMTDWSAYQMQIVGETTDGLELEDLIDYRQPALVITDVVLSRKSGLDVLRTCFEKEYPVTFILTTEQSDYGQLRQAFVYRAAEYLEKPIRKDILERALFNVLPNIQQKKIVNIFQEISPYKTNKFFDLTDEHTPADPKDKCSELLMNSIIDYSENFAVGLCFGIYPEVVEEKTRASYQDFVLTTFSLYSEISDDFSRRGLGFQIHKTARMLYMMGVFPRVHQEDYVAFYLEDLIRRLETEYDVQICVGAGLIAEDPSMLYNSYHLSRYAFELFFFEPQPVLEFQKMNREFTQNQTDYESAIDTAFHAILIKSPDALEQIDRAVDVIGAIHFGNWQAALMRVMNFTGELTSRFQRYKLFQGNFYEMQNELQTRVLNSHTFPEAKQCVHEYYERILPTIYRSNKTSTKVIVERVKSYIQENFMNELSIKELSEVACVSPNYFSHMFKNEVGQNYKEYLTNIRMEKALDLILNSDYRLYEISEAVGYNNMRTFVDAFKQRYGHSPTKYKKKLEAER